MVDKAIQNYVQLMTRETLKVFTMSECLQV